LTLVGNQQAKEEEEEQRTISFFANYSYPNSTGYCRNIAVILQYTGNTSSILQYHILLGYNYIANVVNANLDGMFRFILPPFLSDLA